MEDQIILKSPVQKSYLDLLDAHPVKYAYMPIIKKVSEMEQVEAYQNINLIGMEIIAESQESPFFQDETIQRIKEKDLFIWVNAIKLDDDHILFAKFDDDVSIIKGPEYGWQKIVEKGADMIQTDWPSLLNNYRQTTISLLNNGKLFTMSLLQKRGYNMENLQNMHTQIVEWLNEIVPFIKSSLSEI